MKNRHSHRRSAAQNGATFGLTLMEVAIALSVAGMVLAGIWAAASSVNQKNNINQAMQELQTVTRNILNIYQNAALPATALAGCPALPDVTANLINSGAIPLSDVVTGACVSARHPWSGGAGFKVFEYSGGAKTFRVSFYNVPLDACIALLTQATQCDPTQPGCPFQVWTDDASLLPVTPNLGPPTSNWQNMNPTLAAGATLCGANSPPPYTAGFNSVEFDFRL